MTRRVGAVAVLMALVAGIATGCDGSSESTDSDSSESADEKPIEFGVSDLFIETNATDGDTGLQLNLEGEKWGEIQIRDPEGQELLDVRGEGELGGLGLTELSRTVEMYLRPDATSADVPAQFLDPGVETEVEVLAREKSGNQTITEVQAETK
jgi:hypothetical protein